MDSENTDKIRQHLEKIAKELSVNSLIAAIEFGKTQAECFRAMGNADGADAFEKDAEVFKTELVKRNPMYKAWGGANPSLN